MASLDRSPGDEPLDGVSVALTRVVDAGDMVAVMAAQRLQAVAWLLAEARADAGRYGAGLVEVAERSLRLELAAALRVTEHAAGRLITLADAVVDRYPVVHESLAQARITEQHAELLVDAVDTVEPALRDELLGRGLALAEELPVGSFRRRLHREVETLRYDTLDERYAVAVARRRVVIEPDIDAMGWMHLHAPLVELHAIHHRATTIGKVIAAQPGEERTLDQIRADVICDLLIDGTTTVHPETARGIQATVVVTVPALSLLHDTAPAGAVPALVEGIGPIPHTVARELCGAAVGFIRVLTHPETGVVQSYGRTRYRPPPELVRLVKWRADRCMAPGCGIPATRCQVDHQNAWEHGGCTDACNLCPFRQGHHTVKHHGNWHVRQLDGTGGAIEWNSPAGRRYVVHPERRIPTFTPTSAAEAPF